MLYEDYIRQTFSQLHDDDVERHIEANRQFREMEDNRIFMEQQMRDLYYADLQAQQASDFTMSQAMDMANDF